MPQGDRYVTDGALLRCDKGVLVTPLTVLPRPSKVNGRYQANVLDCLPVVNIKPFGVCAITHGPCMPVMPFWTQAHPSGRTIGPGPAAPLLESSVCQCSIGGRIGITVLPVPGMPAPGSGGAGVLAAGQELGQQQAAHERAQDAQAHAVSNDLKEASGGLAVFGLVCLAVGFVFPPAAVVGGIALEVSEGLLVAGVAVDVAVAVDHPTQDNWVTVGGDALALAGGYVVGKVLVGPALGALGRKLAQRAAQKAAAEAEAAAAAEVAAKAAADKVAAEAAAEKIAAEQAAAKAANDKLASEQAATRAAEQEAKQERLSRDPQSGKVNAKSVSEAATITQAEEAGLVNNPRRPDTSRGEPNLDFAVDGPEPYKYCDVKTPVEPGKFRGTSAETQSERIAENIKAQKAGSKDVLHIVDLKNVPAEAKADFKTKVLDKLSSSQGVEFIND